METRGVFRLLVLTGAAFGAAVALGSLPARAVPQNWEATYAGAVGGGGAMAQDIVVSLPGVPMFLFAELEGDVFQSNGRGTGGHEEAEGKEAGGSGEGCAGEGGPGNFRLELFEEGATQPLCFAERPKYPGWMRDPRLACAIGASDKERRSYTLRVSFAGQGAGHEKALAGPPGAGEMHLFRLRVNLIAASSLPHGVGRVRFPGARRR